MGGLLAMSSRSAISPSDHDKPPEKYSKKELRVMQTYLPLFVQREKSTERHRQIAGAHWDKVFKEAPQRGPTVAAISKAQAQVKHEAKHLDKQQNSKITLLDDIFYAHLEKHSPELKPVFRSSMHIRGKVLVHISVGMRTLIASENFVDKVLPLTKTHRRFGVKPEHFQPLGSALLHAMEVVSGEHWSPEVEDAWKRLFVQTSVILIQAHESNRGQVNETSGYTSDLHPKKSLPPSDKMGAALCRDVRNTVAPLAFGPSVKPFKCEPFSRAEKKIIDQYMPAFIGLSKSNDHHRHITGVHWDKVFKDTPPKRDGSMKSDPPKAPSASEAKHLQEPQSSKITLLYDIFYAHLEKHSPELKPVFRSSMHIRGKVLVHISVGMRTLIASENFVDKVLPLTKTHRRFGVKPEHFQPLGSALLHAMEVVSGEHWSPEVEDAWKRLFVQTSVILIRTQKKVDAKVAKEAAKPIAPQHKRIQFYKAAKKPPQSAPTYMDIYPQFSLLKKPSRRETLPTNVTTNATETSRSRWHG
ncbi:hypothetical protein P43SY_001871 [Pythium insidiosum]|uniref:Globin domain-containing protein n=1 Tax=Pythium insidiosum TaxID=114742 RepID=A0AAD5M118_PYTIN|nr:hypothetical protein P43SY_001871 [Pythium insidiosum]